MRFNKIFSLLEIVCVTFIMVIMTFSTLASTSTESYPKPDILSTSGWDIGGATYSQFAAVGEGMLNKFGIKFRLFPGAGGVDRILSSKTGITDFAGVSVDAYFAIEGQYDFGELNWGPQPLRIAYQAVKVDPYAISTRANSGIKTFSDIKGRKVPYVPGSPNTNGMIMGALAWAGLTYDDVEVIEVPSYTAQLNALIDGTTDIAAMPAGSSAAYELEASPHGLYWIPMPPENEEGWAAFLKTNPTYFPINATWGAGLSKENPVWLPTFILPTLACYPDLEESKAYWLTKAIWESYDLYKDVNEMMEGWNLEEALKQPCYYPWHEGSIKYLKEVGLWTERYEENQQAMLLRQKRLQELWKTVSEEALEQGLSINDFRNYWLEKRAEEFPEYLTPTK